MTTKEQEEKETTARDDKVIKSGHTPSDIILRRIHLAASIFEGWRNGENLCCVGKQCFILMFLASATSTNTVFLPQVYFRKQIVLGILCFLTGTGTLLCACHCPCFPVLGKQDLRGRNVLHILSTSPIVFGHRTTCELHWCWNRLKQDVKDP